MSQTVELAQQLLKSAFKEVPAMKWAVAVGGLCALVSLVLVGLDLEPVTAVIGALLVLVFMVLLVVFANLASTTKGLRFLAMLLAWSFSLLAVFSTGLFFFCFFFDYPKTIPCLLKNQCDFATTSLPGNPSTQSPGALSRCQENQDCPALVQNEALATQECDKQGVEFNCSSVRVHAYQQVSQSIATQEQKKLASKKKIVNPHRDASPSQGSGNQCKKQKLLNLAKAQPRQKALNQLDRCKKILNEDDYKAVYTTIIRNTTSSREAVK